MCGLAGVLSTHLIEKDIDVFRQLLIVSALRGWHSTGTAIIGREEYKKPMEGIVDKEVGDPYVFFRGTDFEKNVKEYKSKKAILGHCRYATKGEINRDNAHPFIVNPTGEEGRAIVGVHNGTVWGDFDYKDKYPTDSQALYHNIAEKGLTAG